MLIRAFITHKLDERFADCQDRFSVNKGTKSIALSDGMSESIFQKIWAEILVDKYVNDPGWIPKTDSLLSLCNEWKDKVDSIIPNLSPSAQRRTKNSLALHKSAGATFVGIRFTNNNSWEGCVIGDSCAIEIEEDSKSPIFHTSQKGDFDNSPDYLDSDPKKKGKGEVLPINGTLSKGKKLLLVSDPFSDYIYKHKDDETITSILSDLLAVHNHEEFENLVKKFRDNGMHNDDSTLIIIEADHESSEGEWIDNIQELIDQEQKTKTLIYKPKVEQQKPDPNSYILTLKNIKTILYDEEVNIAGIISTSIEEDMKKFFDSIDWLHHKKKKAELSAKKATDRIIKYLINKISDDTSFHI